MRLNIYIDGFNLYYGCLKRTPNRWLDPMALATTLFPNDEIHRIRYFTAKVSSRPGNPQQDLRQQIYLRALRTIPEVSVHYGHYLTTRTRMPAASPPPNTVAVIKTEEKGSDVNLAAHLLLDAFKKDFEAAAVVSNDSDLRTPISIVRKELALPVGIVNPHPKDRRSRALSGDFFKQIRPSTPSQCQFPETLIDSQGAFSRPARWQ